MFHFRKINDNLQHLQKFANTKKKTVKMTYRAPQLWNVNPTRVKDAPFLSTFKEK